MITINGKPGIVGRQEHKVKGCAEVPVIVNGTRVTGLVVPARNATNPDTGRVSHVPATTVFEYEGHRYYFVGDARNMGFAVKIEGFTRELT